MERENLRKSKFTSQREREREKGRGVNGGVNVKERIWFSFSRPFLLSLSAGGALLMPMVCCREAMSKEKIQLNTV